MSCIWIPLQRGTRGRRFNEVFLQGI